MSITYKPTLEWLANLADDALIETWIHAGRVKREDAQYWRDLLPLLRGSKYVPQPSWDQQSADMLAAAVDAAIRRGALDPRSEIADCRLDYGEPFSEEVAARHLARRRHGKDQSCISGEKQA